MGRPRNRGIVTGLLTSPAGLRPARPDGTLAGPTPVGYENLTTAYANKREIADRIASLQIPRARDLADLDGGLTPVRTPIGPITVVERPDEIRGRLAEWPAHLNDVEYRTTKTLKSQAVAEGDHATAAVLLNRLEQAERQYIITSSLADPGDVRAVLGVVSGDPARLEAVCLWEVVDLTTSTRAPDTPNFTMSRWNKILYISELTTAPWNVGWSADDPVRGAGTKLIEAMEAKARELRCEGIGLMSLAGNRDFYLSAAKFKVLPGSKDVLIKPV